MEVSDKIKELLKFYEFKIVKHEASNTAIESCDARNIPLMQGVKSLILDLDGKIIEVLISGDKKISLNKLKKKFSVKDAKLADRKVVKEKTGCVVGTVHPFCYLLNNIPSFIDESILRNEVVDFSIGVNDESMEMKVKDFLEFLNVDVIDVGEEIS
jgi:prolyl-tRNA editing enzyme YbaK/EbsC (Cys-tRNA(Pro) deacylase)